MMGNEVEFSITGLDSLLGKFEAISYDVKRKGGRSALRKAAQLIAGKMKEGGGLHCPAGHESGQFRYVKELGGDQYLSKYDTGSLAKRLGNTPEADGDGQKYRGRGLIQITGRANYSECGEALGLDLINQPELLEQPQYAAMSAAWFWSTRGLNALADQKDFAKITRRINGGLNGQADRQSLYEKALKVLA